MDSYPMYYFYQEYNPVVSPPTPSSKESIWFLLKLGKMIKDKLEVRIMNPIGSESLRFFSHHWHWHGIYCSVWTSVTVLQTGEEKLIFLVLKHKGSRCWQMTFPQDWLSMTTSVSIYFQISYKDPVIGLEPAVVTFLNYFCKDYFQI